VRTPRYTTEDEKDEEVFRFDHASKMKEMNPLPQVVGEDNKRREACHKAFKYAAHFSGGHDLVEEFVVAGVWPLGHNTWKNFSFKRIWLPIFGVEEGIPFPHFSLQRVEGEIDDMIKRCAEGQAQDILWDMWERATAPCSGHHSWSCASTQSGF
jgi:hypothetical protein